MLSHRLLTISATRKSSVIELQLTVESDVHSLQIRRLLPDGGEELMLVVFSEDGSYLIPLPVQGIAD